MAGYKSETKNNICAHLDLTTPNARHFTEIIAFLRRSRIFAAISTVHVPYQSHQQDFWNSDIDCEVEPPVIRGKVLGHDVVISAEHIKRICGFQDSPDQPILLERYLDRGCFMRCKYVGDLEAGILNKAFMSPQFKYLAHVLIHCLGSRRGGFYDIRETIQCAFVALVLNRPFNFSEMIFTHMKENVMLKGDKKFLMPKQPERYYFPEIDGDTRKHKVILKWPPPKVMKKIPLRKMRQDFMEGFRWWYYDGRTGEAVVVL
ncbi:hypothetical protein R6Q57_014614 [Mikania cordata]